MKNNTNIAKAMMEYLENYDWVFNGEASEYEITYKAFLAGLKFKNLQKSKIALAMAQVFREHGWLAGDIISREQIELDEIYGAYLAGLQVLQKQLQEDPSIVPSIS
jgi:hypothetical protein